MSTVRSPKPLSHWHFGFYNPYAIGAGGLAPLSHDSLVATSSSLINFSSRAFSRWVHMDLTWGANLESFPLPAFPPAWPSPLPPEAETWQVSPAWGPGDVWPIAVGPTCCLCFACSYAGDGMYYTSPASRLRLSMYYSGEPRGLSQGLPSPAYPPAPQNLEIDTLSRKYHFSIQSLLTNDHLGAWLASSPYLSPLAFPPAPQNLRMDTLGVTVSRDMSRLLDVQNCNSCCSVVVKGRPKGS